MRRPPVPRLVSLFLIVVWTAASTLVLAGSSGAAAQRIPTLGSLAARVVDRAGRPADALVVIKGAHNRIGRTDGRGVFQVMLPPGRYEVSAVSGAYSTRARRVTVVPNVSRLVTIRLAIAAAPAPAPRAGASQAASGPARPSTQPDVREAAATPRTGTAVSGGSPGTGAAPSGASTSPASRTASTSTGPASTATTAALSGATTVYAWSGDPLRIDGVTASPASTAPGGSARLAVSVVNPTGDRLAYAWQPSGGAVSGTGPSVVWTAPPTAGTYTISVVVSGVITGRKTSGSVSVSVQAGGSAAPAPPGNGAPRITAATADPSTVTPGGTSTLLVQATDPDGDALTFSWQASGGTLAPQGNTAVWTAPGGEGQYTITVRADDGRGQSASASIPVAVSTAPAGTRDPALWPFDKLSPWNYPIGTGARYEPIRSALTGGGFATGSVNTEHYTVAIWLASSSDPIRRIYRRDRNMAYLERRIPDAATPSRGTDGHMIVISPDRRTAVELYAAVKRSDGNWEAAGAAVDVDLRAMGLQLPGGSGVSEGFVVAYGGSATAGVIRAGELRNGIRHALQFVTDPKMWNRFAPGGRTFVWPASSADGYAAQPEPGGYGSSGNLYMGSLVAIPWHVDLAALGLETPEGRVLARALKEYGAYGIDSAGVGDKIVFRFDYAARLAGDLNALLTNWAPFQRDLDRIARQLQVVVNSHNGGYQPAVPGGGGTPRVPLAPDLLTSAGPALPAAAPVLLSRWSVAERRRRPAGRPH